MLRGGLAEKCCVLLFPLCYFSRHTSAAPVRRSAVLQLILNGQDVMKERKDFSTQLFSPLIPDPRSGWSLEQVDRMCLSLQSDPWRPFMKQCLPLWELEPALELQAKSRSRRGKQAVKNFDFLPKALLCPTQAQKLCQKISGLHRSPMPSLILVQRQISIGVDLHFHSPHCFYVQSSWPNDSCVSKEYYDVQLQTSLVRTTTLDSLFMSYLFDER